MTEAVEKAYAALRDKIFSGELQTGDRLKERDICAELQVSRTPVREALRRLQADGLVTIEPRRGGVVAGFTATEAEEIYSLGILLESYAARLAASQATEAGLAELEDLISAMEAALTAGPTADRRRYLELDSAFHSAILEMTGNRRLASAVRQVVGAPVLVKAFTHYSDSHLRDSLQQHRSILAALKARDADWAEAAMRSHIHAAKRLLLGTLAADVAD